MNPCRRATENASKTNSIFTAVYNLNRGPMSCALSIDKCHWNMQIERAQFDPFKLKWKVRLAGIFYRRSVLNTESAQHATAFRWECACPRNRNAALNESQRQSSHHYNGISDVRLSTNGLGLMLARIPSTAFNSELLRKTEGSRCTTLTQPPNLHTNMVFPFVSHRWPSFSLGNKEWRRLNVNKGLSKNGTFNRNYSLYCWKRLLDSLTQSSGYSFILKTLKYFV